MEGHSIESRSFRNANWDERQTLIANFDNVKFFSFSISLLEQLKRKFKVIKRLNWISFQSLTTKYEKFLRRLN